MTETQAEYQTPNEGKPLSLILSKIQKELVCPKGQYNQFGKYNYRSCEDIFEAVKNILPEGVYLIVSDEIIFVEGRWYIKATAKLSNGESSIENTAYAREPESRKGMDDAQVSGATSSYARKYSLNGLFLIDDVKDPDASNKHGKEESKPPADIKTEPGPVTDEQKTRIYELCKSKGMTKSEQAAIYKFALDGEQSNFDFAHDFIKHFVQYYDSFISFQMSQADVS